MKRRILLYGLFLTAVAVLICGMLIGGLTRSYYLRLSIHHMKDLSALLIGDLEDASAQGIEPDYQAIATAVAGRLERQSTDETPRITIIRLDGAVLGDSSADPDTLENHLERPEVQQALTAGVGWSSRYSSTLHADLLYLAERSDKARLIVRLSMPQRALTTLYIPILLYCGLGMIIGCAISFTLAFLLSRRVFRPMEKLAQATRSIADGNLGHRVNLTDDPLYRSLAGDFNRMAARLEETLSALKERNLNLSAVLDSIDSGLLAIDQDERILLMNPTALRMLRLPADAVSPGTLLTSLKIDPGLRKVIRLCLIEHIPQAEEITLPLVEPCTLRVGASVIRDADGADRGCIVTLSDVTRMRQLEQVRTQFVANVTHELRTPLTSIRGYVETLRAGAIRDPATADRFLEIIDIESERLHNLIGDLLTLSDIESRTHEAETEPVSIGRIASAVADVIGPIAREKGVTVHVDIQPGLQVQANADRIKQLLLNLADNGVKYNRPNGELWITGRRETGKVLLSVRDTGIGIAPEHLTRIFERFYRVDKSRSREMGGTGLGLSIVKHIASLYGGNIRMRSEPGEGTECIVELPGQPPEDGQSPSSAL